MITIAVILTNVTSGGTKRYADEMVEAWKIQGHRILFVQVVERIINIKILEKDCDDRNIFLFDDNKLLKLTEILKFYGVQLLHIQHLLNANLNFFELHRKLKIPFFITLHDYYSICPFIKLTDINDVYCGEKGEIECKLCLKERNFYSYTFNKKVNSIIEWRSFWQKYLEEASLVIVPSTDMEKRINKYFKNIQVRVFENPEIISFNKIKSVGLIGFLSYAKGGKKVKECVKYVAKYKIPIKFIVFGEIPDFEFTKEESQYIEILGAYKEDGIYELISKYNIDFFWFPGVCPETYSYTLSIPIKLKIPCLSTNLGAIAERITTNKWGKTYPWDAETKEIVQKLVLFDSNEFKNKDFAIKNITFGDFFEFYNNIISTKSKENDFDNVISLSKFPKINKQISKAEFYYIWAHSKVFQKLIILKWLKVVWIQNAIKKSGMKKFVKKFINSI